MSPFFCVWARDRARFKLCGGEVYEQARAWEYQPFLFAFLCKRPLLSRSSKPLFDV